FSSMIISFMKPPNSSLSISAVSSAFSACSSVCQSAPYSLKSSSTPKNFVMMPPPIARTNSAANMIHVAFFAYSFICSFQMRLTTLLDAILSNLVEEFIFQSRLQDAHAVNANDQYHPVLQDVGDLFTFARHGKLLFAVTDFIVQMIVEVSCRFLH